MMNEVEMKVMPSYREEECSIIFSFHFKDGRQKIGEAVICTCSEAFLSARSDLKEFSFTPKAGKNSSIQNTIAYFTEFQIIEEYKRASLKKIMEFLNIIGIKKFLYQRHTSLFHTEIETPV
jgi:hypothetical protein